MKKLHRFLLQEEPNGNPVLLTNTEIVHLIKNVLRLVVGEYCVLFADDSDDYICKITDITKKSVSLNVEQRKEKVSIPKKITACISITKRDNFELVIQKLTELGAQKIVPIISDRTIKQSIREDRLQKISDEALEQCGGSTRVSISAPISLKQALEANQNKTQLYFDIEGESNIETKNTDYAFYVGPEGGWSDDDKELFKKYNVKSYKLGNTVLRAETAAIVAAYKLIWY